MRAIQDEQLIKKAIEGDEQAFRLIIENYQTTVFQSVFAILRNQKDAEDACQEVFIKIFYALSNYQFQGFKTWVTRIAVNHAIDVKRKKEKMKAQSIDETICEFIPAKENTEEDILKSELQKKVRKRLSEIPENYQEVIDAYYIREKSYKEIASELQIEITTVKMKLYRARNWMKKHWKEGDFR